MIVHAHDADDVCGCDDFSLSFSAAVTVTRCCCLFRSFTVDLYSKERNDEEEEGNKIIIKPSSMRRMSDVLVIYAYSIYTTSTATYFDSHGCSSVVLCICHLHSSLSPNDDRNALGNPNDAGAGAHDLFQEI